MINYTKDCLNVSYDSKSEDILFIPVPYLNGMIAKLNGNDIGIIVFVAFIKFYNEKMKIKLLHKISYIIYLILYTILLLVFYIMPFIMFIASSII